MTFTPKDWRNATTHEGGGDETTPITAASIEDLETRVSDYTDLRAGTGGDGVFNVKDYGAVGDGSGNDAPEIEAAIADAEVVGGTVHIPDGVYAIATQIEIPAGVSLRGVGAVWADYTAGTVFKCTAAGAGLKFTGNTQIHSGFSVDGDSTANNPFRVDLSFGLTFIGINVTSAAQDNIVVYDAQQATFYSCNSTASGRDCLLIDGSTQASLFSRFEADSPGRHGIRFGTDAGTFGAGNGWNRFDHTLVEQQSGVSDDPMVKMERASSVHATLFDDCIFAALAGSGTSVVLLDEASASTISGVEFRSCRFQVNTSGPRIGLNVDIADDLLAVSLTGQTVMVGYISSGVKSTVADTIRLYGECQVNPVGAAVNFIDTASAPVRINAHFAYPSVEFYPGVAAADVAKFSLFTNADVLTYKDRDSNTHALY